MITKIYMLGILLLLTGIVSGQQASDSIVTINLRPKINIGYSSQSSESVSGAISEVSGYELRKSPVATLSESFAGRLLSRGVSSINQASYLVVVDGMITPDPIWNYITPEEIESVVLLKDASTTSIYGIQGANGVLVINTKRGSVGKMKVSLSANQAFIQMTHKPNIISSAEYAKLRNQAAYNDDNVKGMFSQFSEKEIDAFASVSDPKRYPNNDFYNMMVKKLSSFQQINLNVSGGTKNIEMYSNVNIFNQNPLFVQDVNKLKDQVNYNVGLYSRWINYRTNLDIKFNQYLSGFLRLNGNVKAEKQPGEEYLTNAQGVDNSVSNTYNDIYSSLFSLPSTTIGPLTHDGQVVTDPKSTSYPAYGRINRTGYNSSTNINNMAQTGVKVDLGFITKGLSLTGVFGFNVNSLGTLHGKKTYERWQFEKSILDSVVFAKYGSWRNKPLSFFKSSTYSSYQATNVLLNYMKEFGNNRVTATSFMNFQKIDFDLFPSYRANYGLTMNLENNHKYFLKADVAYSGSEQFAPKKRYVFTPSIAASWIASKEHFMNNIKWIDLLKIRTSYGLSGNDKGVSQYLYADKLTIGGGYISDLVYGVNEQIIGNSEIAPEIVKTANVGIDLEIFKKFAISMDLYNQKIDNMIINSSGIIPWYIGYSASTFPKANLGKMMNGGIDANISYRTDLSSKMDLYSSMIITYNKNEVIESGQVDNGEGYYLINNVNGHPFGQSIGYVVDKSGKGGSFYSSEEDIYNSNLEFQLGTPRSGDLKFKDLNHDNIINEKDRAAIGGGSIPPVNFGLSLGSNYKTKIGVFGASCLFQGVAFYKVYLDLNESMYEGVYSDVHMNAWTQEKYDNGQRNFSYPALSLKTSYSHNPNDFFIENGSFIRLKNLVVSYTVPEETAKKLHLENLKFNLSGQNLITIDGLKTKNVDPEVRNLYTFQTFRVINIGATLNF